MKKITAVFLAVLFAAVFFLPSFASGVTSAATPADPPALLFSKKLGTGYKNAPTPIACSNGFIVAAAGKYIYKLDAQTGEIAAKSEMESVSTYTAVAPLIAQAFVFMPLDDGIVQAFRFSDLQPVWIYHDPLGGQGLTPVVYENGRLYTAFWNGETDDANFVCLPANGSGEQNAIWTFTSKGGFYRTAPLILGDYLISGSENGERVNLPDAPARILSINKNTGALCSFSELPGDIRAGIGYDAATGACYTASKSGVLARFFVNETTGALSSQKTVQLAGGSTVTPLVYNGRLYTACSGGKKGIFTVLDAENMEAYYTVDLPGTPQGDFLLSTAYEAIIGKVLIYTTYNAPPGGVYLFEDGPGQNEAVCTELFVPPEDMRQYCFCPITAGEDGTIYYKNDSGTIFALEGNQIEQPALSKAADLLRRFIALVIRVFQIMRIGYSV